MSRTPCAPSTLSRLSLAGLLALAGCGGGPGTDPGPLPGGPGVLTFTPTPLAITPVGTTPTEYDIACAGTQVYVAYAANGGVHVVRSTDAGVSWASPVQIGPRTSTEIRVAASGSGVHVAWIDLDLTPDAVVVQSSTDGGATWKPSGDVLGTGFPEDLSLVREGNSVWAAWEDADLIPHVKLNRSFDGGGTWLLSPLQPKGEAFGETDPRLALLGGVVRLAYRGVTTSDVLRYTQSADTGVSWTSSIDVANAVGGTSLRMGDLVAGPSGVFLTWSRSSGTSPNQVSDTSGAASLTGVAWTTERLLDHNGTGAGYSTTGRHRGGTASTSVGCTVAFLESTTETGPLDQLRATLFTAPGGTIVPAPDGRLQRNLPDASDAYTASICASQSTLYAFWSDNRGYVVPLQYDLWMTFSTNAGQTWATDRRISLPTAGARDPLCCADPTHVYVVWREGSRLWTRAGSWQ